MKRYLKSVYHITFSSADILGNTMLQTNRKRVTSGLIKNVGNELKQWHGQDELIIRSFTKII